MKQQFERLVQKIDAMTLRERVITFGMAVALMIFLINSFLIEPQFVKQKKLTLQLQEEQTRISEIQTMIQQKIAAHSIDPDLDSRMRLQNLRQQYQQAQNSLMDMQKGLVSPEKMTGLLDDILKRHGKLHLLSLKTLPVTGLGATTAGATASAPGNVPPGAAKAGETDLATSALYRHGVEITVQGNYLDMLQYMTELEAMPWQLFWGRANLQVNEYPTATLTLTLFTLSLDKKWLNL